MSSIANQNLSAALQHYFGFDTFKGNQESIIRSILSGRDTFVIMPTGGGKSLCYQLPALMMEGTAIVISPLIALMKNQVDSIRGYSQGDDVAHFLNSSLNRTQIKQVKQDIQDGKTKLLYIAPETLTKDENLEFFQATNISFVAVDEAHCISEWGHDFRPEYRRIRTMIDTIDPNTPIIALTATATPKVRTDIVKILEMKEGDLYISSFNRDNLYYEVRPKGKKEQAMRQVVQLVKSMPNESGIIYVQNRKSTEDIAQFLSINGVKAAPYHAGLDPKLRSQTQDAFLMEDIKVIVATIAFGMGIDKPDVRFVIHYDIPKSIENYYQETGRAGRDGLLANCVTFFNYSDVTKLEKFLRDKPVAEREMGGLLMHEIMAYAETAACRRKFLLHYFGEEYSAEKCNNLCDNCRFPKEKTDVKKEMKQALQSISALKELYTIKPMVDFMMGKETKDLVDFEHTKLSLFGIGRERDETYWNSIFRQALLNNLLDKDIENYGVLKLTEAGRQFIDKPEVCLMAINHDFEKLHSIDEEAMSKGSVLDDSLLKMLKDLRRRVAKEKKLPPFVIFQDPSLEDMATQYPITMDEMASVSGVTKAKALRYAKPFIELIAQYVEENEIERPTDIVVKQVANKSKTKISIIQGIDKKLPLKDIAFSADLSMDELMEELNTIVMSGTRINLDYCIDEGVDEYALETIYEYFMTAQNDSVEEAFRELKDEDVTLEEIQLVRIKFISEVAN